jgi:hypothetical protein
VNEGEEERGMKGDGMNKERIYEGKKFYERKESV